MSNYGIVKDSQETLAALQKIIADTVRNMPDFRNCTRTQKAKVRGNPSNGRCDVSLIGDDTMISVYVSSAMANIKAGDIVLITYTFNSLSNGIITAFAGTTD